jgi:hypothetical protein
MLDKLREKIVSILSGQNHEETTSKADALPPADPEYHEKFT